MESRSFTVCKACSAFNPPTLAICHRCEATLERNDRRFERVELQLRGTASDSYGGSQEIEIWNLSMGGLMFRSERPYREDDILRLRIPLEGDCYTVEAEVRHCIEDHKGYCVGVEFAATSPPFIFKLHAVLKSAGVG